MKVGIVKSYDQPNIIIVYECFQDSSRFYLVIKFSTGVIIL